MFEEGGEKGTGNATYGGDCADGSAPGGRDDKSPGLVTACMIMKNEERCLDACLSSLTGLADEILIEDTGSTDRSIEIARAHGARVIESEWTGDFAFHRNHVLAAATSRWCFMIDADETVEDTDKEQARHHLAGDRLPPILMVRQTLKYPGGRSMNVIVPRFVLRESGVRFIHPIHEQLGVQDCPAILSNVHVVHHGYVDPQELAAKERRNLEIAKRMPEDSIHGLHCRARAAMSVGDVEELFTAAGKLVDLESPPMLRLEAALLAGMAAHHAGRIEELDRFLASAREIAPDAPDVRLLEFLVGADRYLDCLKGGDSEDGTDFIRPFLFWHSRENVKALLEALTGRRSAKIVFGDEETIA